MHGTSGTPKPFLDSNYGTESDNASDVHFGHNPLAGNRKTDAMPESISYEQQVAARHQRSSIAEYAANGDLSLDEVEADVQ